MSEDGKNSGGRPPGSIKPFETDALKQIEAMASYGLPTHEIAAIMGVSKKTLERRYRTHPEVYDAIDRGRAKAHFNMAKKCYDVAMNGNENLIKFWLQTRAGWTPKTSHEVSGPDQGPIETRQIDPSQLSTETINELMNARQVIDVSPDESNDEFDSE